VPPFSSEHSFAADFGSGKNNGVTYGGQVEGWF
jgi:hypothetical protein